MILLLDVGNTNIKIGISDGIKLIDTYRLSTKVLKTADEYYLQLKSLVENYGIFTGFIIASVVPRITEKFRLIATKFFGIQPVVVEPGVKTGIKIQTDNPKEVGADLICAAAGLKDSSRPALIIDLGTATKYIYVHNKSILGVIITPGVRISIKALVGNTALLHDIDIETPKKVLGTTTTTCMQSGVTYGVAAQVDGLIDRIRDEVKADFDVILTGGLSKLIAPLCRRKVSLNDTIVLDGILQIYLRNK